MTRLHKWLLAATATLALAAPFMTAASARADWLAPSDHGGVQSPVVRTWVTYEVQMDFYYPPTGQTWHQGWTYNEYNDGYGHYTYEGFNEFQADLQQLANDGWQGPGEWHGYPIASGTW
jgi:hypothetical protein